MPECETGSYCRQMDYPINDGVEVAVSQDGYTQYSREYEKKELRLSGVAVELEKEGTLEGDPSFPLDRSCPGFRGTEALQLFPAYRESGMAAWIGQGDLTGQVLYDRNGTFRMQAEYAVLEDSTYETGAKLAVLSEQGDRAAFLPSFPCLIADENRCRGYVAYNIGK